MITTISIPLDNNLTKLSIDCDLLHTSKLRSINCRKVSKGVLFLYTTDRSLHAMSSAHTHANKLYVC